MEKRAELALREAVDGVIDEHARLGLPLYIGRDGKVVKLSPTKVRGPLKIQSITSKTALALNGVLLVSHPASSA